MNSKIDIIYMAELMMEIMPKATQAIREEMRAGRGNTLTIPQFRVLAAVNRGLTHNKEIGHLLGVSEAAISRMIDILVIEGLLKKKISKSDRRQSVLTLTPEGKKFYNFIKSDAKARLATKLERMDSNEVAIAIKGLEVLQKNMKYLS